MTAELREVTLLRQTVARLDALVTQLERTYHPPEEQLAAASDTLQRENERLLSLLKANPPPKPTMIPQRRLRLAAAQEWRCAICNQLLPESFHADHIRPFWACFDDSDHNLQVICASPCHLSKTSAEQAARRRAQSAREATAE